MRDGGQARLEHSRNLGEDTWLGWVGGFAILLYVTWPVVQRHCLGSAGVQLPNLEIVAPNELHTLEPVMEQLSLQERVDSLYLFSKFS